MADNENIQKSSFMVSGIGYPAMLNTQTIVSGINCNLNYGYHHDAQSDLNFIHPPGYDEAMKAASYQLRSARVNSDPPPSYSNAGSHPDHGQFGTSEPYFYPHSYHSENSGTETIYNTRKWASYIMVAILIVCLALFTVRFVFSGPM